MAEIRILKPGDEAALEAFLLPRVESSMFLIGNMRAAGLVDGGQVYQGTYAAAFEGGEVVGVVAHYWNGVLIFQVPAYLDALWRAAARVSGRRVKGLLGPGMQVAAAKEAMGLQDDVVQMDETENLYSLALADLVVSEGMCSGSEGMCSGSEGMCSGSEGLHSGRLVGRRIEPRDLELVTAWRVAFAVQGLGEEESPLLWEETRALLERSMERGWSWVLEDRGEPVATSSFNTAIAEAVQIGGVWTPRELRRRGYGLAVVAASLEDARAEGATRAILFTGVENVPAQKAYLALGFQQIGDYRLLLLREGIPV
jgi:RimJ/RimL family protein N-acetyltransferase